MTETYIMIAVVLIAVVAIVVTINEVRKERAWQKRRRRYNRPGGDRDA